MFERKGTTEMSEIIKYKQVIFKLGGADNERCPDILM
jgi:hypothetical protein